MPEQTCATDTSITSQSTTTLPHNDFWGRAAAARRRGLAHRAHRHTRLLPKARRSNLRAATLLRALKAQAVQE